MAYNISMDKKEIEYIIDSLNIILREDDVYSSDEKLYNSGIKIINRLKKILKPIKKSSAKGKGRDLQKWVCERIADLFQIEYNQQDDNCVIHSREMGQPGIDIIIRGYLKDFFPFAIECKSSEQLNLLKTIQQAKKNSKNNDWWIIVHKNKSMKNPAVIMSWDCFYSLNKEILKGME
jgi:hypothetical protein